MSLIVNILDNFYSWINSNPTVALALATTASVVISAISVPASILLSKKSIDKNSDLVEANKEAVEETRKDHRRESIKDLIIRLDEIKKKVPKPRTIMHRTTNGPFAVGRSFEELDEWDLEIPNHLRGFIREETTSESPDLLSEYDEYKRDYKNYNNQYRSLQRSISSFLKIRLVDIDWPEKVPEGKNEYRPRPNLSVEEAKQRIQDDSDRIAERIVEDGVVFPGHGNEYLSRVVYRAVKEEHGDKFEELREKQSELQTQYKALTQGKGPLYPGDFNKFIRFLRKKYEIPEIELGKEKKDDEDEKEIQQMPIGLLEDDTIKVELESNPVADSADVYIFYEEYDKTEDDIDKDDYESFDEYLTAVDEETPGTPYDSIEVLSNGWLKCVNDHKNIWGEDVGEENKDRIHHSTDLYPPHVVEKIHYFTVTAEDRS